MLHMQVWQAPHLALTTKILVHPDSVMVAKISCFDIRKIGGRRPSKQEEPVRVLSLWIWYHLERYCWARMARLCLAQPKLELHRYESRAGRLEMFCVGVSCGASRKCSPWLCSPFACVWEGFLACTEQGEFFDAILQALTQSAMPECGGDCPAAWLLVHSMAWNSSGCEVRQLENNQTVEKNNQ